MSNNRAARRREERESQKPKSPKGRPVWMVDYKYAIFGKTIDEKDVLDMAAAPFDFYTNPAYTDMRNELDRASKAGQHISPLVRLMFPELNPPEGD